MRDWLRRGEQKPAVIDEEKIARLRREHDEIVGKNRAELDKLNEHIRKCKEIFDSRNSDYLKNLAKQREELNEKTFDVEFKLKEAIEANENLEDAKVNFEKRKRKLEDDFERETKSLADQNEACLRDAQRVADKEKELVKKEEGIKELTAQSNLDREETTQNHSVILKDKNLLRAKLEENTRKGDELKQLLDENKTINENISRQQSYNNDYASRLDARREDLDEETQLLNKSLGEIEIKKKELTAVADKQVETGLQLRANSSKLKSESDRVNKEIIRLNKLKDTIKEIQ